MVKCIHCHDTGICQFCKGTGKFGRLKCPHCNGTGVCRFCQGKSANKTLGSRTPRPQYGQPQYGQPQYGQPQYGQPQYGQPQYGQPQYGQPAQAAADPEQQLEVLLNTLAAGGLMASVLKTQLKTIRKFGAGFSELSTPMMKRFREGSDRDKILCAKLAALLGSSSIGLFTEIKNLLDHPNSIVREGALDALLEAGKYAAIAEEMVKIFAEQKSDKKLKKKANSILKKLSKISADEKLILIEEEKTKNELLKEVKKIEVQAKSIDKSQLKKAESDLSKYKNIFFMSHALPDFPWVEKVIKEISSWPGCYCWTCENDIVPGSDWLMEIYKGLDMMNWYILFWSDHAENSKWTNEEIKEAKTRNVAKGTPKISIVNLGKDDWPRLLSRHQGAVVTNDEELQAWLQNLKSQVSF
ncbi:MAG: TIR domain-containing protein [Promethearchaeota archaeon]